MKKLRNLIAVMAMMSMAAVLTGCGDDDDNDDDDAPPIGGPEQFAPMDEASLTAQNKTYTVNVAGQEEIKLTFPAAGQYQLEQGGATEVGSISGATRDVNRWTMNVTPNEGQDGAQAGVLQLDFTGNNAGTWTFTPTGGAAETGTFTVTTPDVNPDTGDTGTTDRTTLSNKTLQVNYPGGGGEKFQFLDGTNVSYEDGAQTGTYTWNQAEAKVNVTLNNGNLFEITIPEGSNAATVVFRQDAGSNPQTDTGTYTLQ